MNDTLQIPPHSILAESSLVGAIIVDPSAWSRVSGEIEEADFYRRDHRLIFKAAQSLASAHSPIDIVTVAEQMERDDTLREIGGLPQLVNIAKDTVSTVNAGEYASLIKDLATLRALIKAGVEIQDKAYRGKNNGNARDIIAEAHRRIASVEAMVSRGARWKVLSLKDVVGKVLDDIESRLNSKSMPGVPSGFPRLDRKTGGFQKSDLTIIAARPRIGKTAMLCNLALSGSKACHRVAIASSEQPSVQIVQRMLAIVGGVDSWKLRNPRALNDAEWSSITTAVSELAERDVHIWDAPAPTVEQISSRIEGVNPDILFVDYVQRLKGPGVGIYDRVSGVAQGLKELARHYDIPVVALAQINRQGASGASLEHLKGSGSLEEEADEVIILEREEGSETHVNLILEKNRHGPTGEIPLYFDAPKMRFTEIEQSEYA